MLFLNDEDEYPNLNVIWQDLCQMQYTQGIMAFLIGLMSDIVCNNRFFEEFANTDFLLRFFDDRILELKAIQLNKDIDLANLRELVTIVFLQSCLSLREFEYHHDPTPEPELLKGIFEFCRNQNLTKRDLEEELTDEMKTLAYNYLGPITTSKRLKENPVGPTSRLCQEVIFLCTEIDCNTHDLTEAAPFIVNYMLKDALFFSDTPEDGWKINSILEFCENSGFYLEFSGCLRYWLRNDQARQLLADEIGL